MTWWQFGIGMLLLLIGSSAQECAQASRKADQTGWGLFFAALWLGCWTGALVLAAWEVSA